MNSTLNNFLDVDVTNLGNFVIIDSEDLGNKNERPFKHFKESLNSDFLTTIRKERTLSPFGNNR